MARALIVGCGCRGRELGADLVSAQWAVRGTTRRADRTMPIAEAGIEAVVANPDLVFDLLEHLDGVTMIFWLLGTARGERTLLSAIHGPRLERVLEEIVDTPVRGFVYEAGGTVDESILDRGDVDRRPRLRALADPGRDRPRRSGGARLLARRDAGLGRAPDRGSLSRYCGGVGLSCGAPACDHGASSA